MKCPAHPSVDASFNCIQCGTPLCAECNGGQDPERPICRLCIATSAASAFSSEQADEDQRVAEMEESAKDEKERFVALKYAIIIGALIFIPVRYFTLYEQPDPAPVDLNDPYEVTEEAILNLWLISDMLAEGTMPPVDFICPGGSEAYEVQFIDGDIVVSDPHPEVHGFVSMTVSKNKPVPELIDMQE